MSGCHPLHGGIRTCGGSYGSAQRIFPFDQTRRKSLFERAVVVILTHGAVSLLRRFHSSLVPTLAAQIRFFRGFNLARRRTGKDECRLHSVNVHGVGGKRENVGTSQTPRVASVACTLENSDRKSVV